MALIKLLTSGAIFYFLYGCRCYWYPLISWLVTIIVIASISWWIGRRVCRLYILNSFLPRVHGRDKAVLITGCDSGFGQMLALCLNKSGFHVFAGCLDAVSASEELESLSTYEDRMTILQMNVTKQSEIDDAFSKVSSFLQSNNQGVTQLFALVNNAGIANGALIEWSSASSISDYESVVNVNLYGVIRVTRRFLPLIRSSKGRIINLSSILARTSMLALNKYCVSKAACAKFSEGLMSEMGKFGVKVIDINPWFYKTPMLTPDRILSNLRSSWDEASDEVKSAYGGEGYFDEISKSCAFTVTDKRNVCQDPQEVVHAMMDAITSYEPDVVYRLIPLGYGIVFWIVNDFLPWDLAIHVRRLIDSLPKYIKKRRHQAKVLDK